MKKVSIVIPVFNEEDIVGKLLERLGLATEGLDYRFEFLLVNDGSRDKTLERLLKLQATEPRLRIINLTRNWGHQNAFNAGLDLADGDAVVLMDGDLEDPPELIPTLIEKWEEGAQVVKAVKRSRVDTPIRKAFFKLFYWLISLTASIVLEKNVGMFSLVDKRVAEELRRCKEKNKYYVGLRNYVGFKHVELKYDREARFSGRPKQTLRRLFSYGFNAIFAFTFLPIRLLSILGFFIMTASVFLGIFVIVARILNLQFWIFTQQPGWTSIILGILFLIAFQFISMGVLGEYLARILDEVRGRPYYLVDVIYEPVNTEKEGNGKKRNA